MFGQNDKDAIDLLQQIGESFRLVVIHPNFVNQHLFLGALIQQNAVYVRFDSQSTLTRDDMAGQLRRALEAQVDRDSIRAGDVLILDECDRAIGEELDVFLTEVLDAVGNGRVFVLTQVAPQVALHNEAVRSKTCFLPVNESLMLWDYAQRNREKPVLLEVRALGTGRVMLNGKLVNNWDGVLPRSLFFFLIDKGMTTRNDIFDTFWPNLSVREATNVFHVTKRKISEVLGVDLTNYWSGFYHISPQIELSYDVVQFSERVQDSVIADTDDSARLLTEAANLYRDHFITSMQNPWVEKRRQELRQTYGDALIALAKIQERRGAKMEALGTYLRAFATNPQREDITRSVMLLYREMGMPADSLAVYRRLEDELQTILGVAPARDLQELAQEIQRSIGGVR